MTFEFWSVHVPATSLNKRVRLFDGKFGKTTYFAREVLSGEPFEANSADELFKKVKNYIWK